MLLVLLTCLAPRLRRPLPGTFPVDFNVYWSAAALVRHGAANQIYTGADRGGDPQKAIAAAGTPILNEATAQGLGFVGLYVYPPLLADLIVPYTFMPLSTAAHVWLASNLLFLLLTSVLITRLLDISWKRGAAGLVPMSLICFTPVLQTLHDGQITIFLLLLWTAGTLLYKRGWFASSGAVFALAAAIKLTPLLVVVPFIIWRKWRVVGAFVLTVLGLGVFCLFINSWQTTWLYFTRVMPAMSGSIPFITNFSISAATARWLTVLHSGAVSGYPASLPLTAVRIGRLVPVLVMGAAVALLLRSRRIVARDEQVMTLGLLSLLAPILSPVSWFHAYSMAFVAFALLWNRTLRAPDQKTSLAILTLVSLLLGSAVSENLLTALDGFPRYAGLATWLQAVQLVLAVALVLHEFWTAGNGGAAALKSTTLGTRAPATALLP